MTEENIDIPDDGVSLGKAEEKPDNISIEVAQPVEV